METSINKEEIKVEQWQPPFDIEKLQFKLAQLNQITNKNPPKNMKEDYELLIGANFTVEELAWLLSSNKHRMVEMISGIDKVIRQHI